MIIRLASHGLVPQEVGLTYEYSLSFFDLQEIALFVWSGLLKWFSHPLIFFARCYATIWIFIWLIIILSFSYPCLIVKLLYQVNICLIKYLISLFYIYNNQIIFPKKFHFWRSCFHKWMSSLVRYSFFNCFSVYFFLVFIYRLPINWITYCSMCDLWQSSKKILIS